MDDEYVFTIKPAEDVLHENPNLIDESEMLEKYSKPIQVNLFKIGTSERISRKETILFKNFSAYYNTMQNVNKIKRMIELGDRAGIILLKAMLNNARMAKYRVKKIVIDGQEIKHPDDLKYTLEQMYNANIEIYVV